MKSIVIPLEFLKAIGDKPPYTRIYWVKWLADYTDELFRNDFPTYFQKQMDDKKLKLETIKEAYEFGIVFFKDGFTFLDEKPNNKPTKEELEVVEKVILYLNEKSNSTYTTNKTNTTYILARLKEGFSLVDFKRVIDKKSAQWLGTEQQKYLRPNTLFLPSKFENYLNESETINNKDAKPNRQSSIDKLSNASTKAKEFFNRSS
jgi:uncharacterized phage protein (TIGR02220 family)